VFVFETRTAIGGRKKRKDKRRSVQVGGKEKKRVRKKVKGGNAQTKILALQNSSQEQLQTAQKSGRGKKWE